MGFFLAEPRSSSRARTGQTGPHRPERTVQHLGNLLVREVLDLAQPERLSPLLGQSLERPQQVVGQRAVEDLAFQVTARTGLDARGLTVTEDLELATESAA